MENKKKGGKLKWILIVVVAIVVLAAVFGGEDDDSPKKVGEVNNSADAGKSNEDNGDESNAGGDSEIESKEDKKDSKTDFFPGDVVETKTLRITFVSAEDYISDNQFIQPKDGNKFIKASFEFENIGKDDEYVSEFEFKCYADGYDSEQKYIGDDTLSATLSAGMKVKGSVIFEVPINAAEVLIKYETNFISGKKVNFYVVKQ